MHRRKLIISSLACAASGIIEPAMATANSKLGNVAKERGLVFGAAVQYAQLQSDRAYATLITEHCDMITPEWEMKWGAIEERRGNRDYSRSDWLVGFAEQHGMAVRGHAAAWHNNIPDWAMRVLGGKNGKDLYDAQIRQIVGHYLGRIKQWDVVNEGLFPANKAPGGIGKTILYNSFGKEYIRDAFFLAREADPHAVLYYNDENFFYDDPDHESRRRYGLQLMEWLLSEGAPVQGLGIESHLVPRTAEFSQRIYSDFLAEVAAMGLEIMITELDVSDRFCGTDIYERDQTVADHAKQYLEVALDQRAVKGVITWGLSDRYTWLNGKHRWARSDGLPNRCLPFDTQLKPKPLYHAIANALSEAPLR